MRLRQVHQILMVSAIALAVIFAVRAAVIYSRSDLPGDLALAAGSLAVGMAMAIYLRRVRAKWREQG
ncbi:MAG: hypothetical protein WKG00_16510 [Polyangiaceae bacterium]